MDDIASATSHVLGRLPPNKFISIYPHSSAVCHNLTVESKSDEIKSIAELSQKFCQFPYEVSYPLPSSSPTLVDRSVVNGIDPGLSLVKEKKFWQKYKTHLLKYCKKKDAESIEDVLKHMSRKKHSLTHNALLLVDHLRKDPDEFFNANYNLYYTGGNMTSFSTGSMTFLARPKSYPAGEFVALEQLPVQSSHDSRMTDSESIAPTDGKGSIFQLEATDRFILSRQKKRVCLFSVNEESDKLRAKREIFIDSKVPYYSISLFGEKYCTLSCERKLEIFDIAVGKPSMNGTLDCEEGVYMSDKWCSTYFVDDNRLIFIDRSSVGFVDLRVKNSVLDRWYFVQLGEYCDEGFCGAQGSNGLQYIATNHQLVSFDPRAGFIQRWTHGIMHSPAHISVLPNDSNDKIFIGSQRGDCVVFIENDVSQNNPISRIQPYALPSLIETLHMAHLNGTCYRNVVHSRFSMCLTGLCSFQNGSVSELYRTTSAGDLFCQYLKKSNREETTIKLDDDAVRRLKEWEKQCESLLSKNNKCFASDVVNAAHLKEIMLNIPEEKYTEPSPQVDISKAEWSISKKQLLSYRDYLAPKLLEAWGIDDLEEWAEVPDDDQSGSESSSSDEVFTENVTKWIKSYHGDIEEDSNVNKPNTSAQTEQDLTLPSTPLAKIKTKEPASERKPFVSGF